MSKIVNKFSESISLKYSMKLIKRGFIFSAHINLYITTTLLELILSEKF